MGKKTIYSVEELKKIGYRIAKIRTELCAENNTLFAEKLNIAKQTASNICNGERSIGKKTIEKILDVFPQVNRAWLILGEGDMLKSDGNSQTITGNNNHHNSNSNIDSRLLKMLEDSQQERLKLLTIIENLTNR